MNQPHPSTKAPGFRLRLGLPVLALLMLSGIGCRTEMYDQPRYDTFEPSSFFSDGLSARPLVAGTVPRGWSRTDEHLYYGRVDGELSTSFPFEIDEPTLERGRDQYNVFCSPCHGGLGDGQGMIVQRGMPKPPSLHEDRLREVPVGHLYDVINRGFGAMYSYSHRIKPHDRWAVVAYIKALQLSQNAPIDSLDEFDRQQFELSQEAAQ